MSWTTDHRNAVIKRWREKFKDSKMSAEEFKEMMYNRMIEYGWTEKEAKIMSERAVKIKKNKE